MKTVYVVIASSNDEHEVCEVFEDAVKAYEYYEKMQKNYAPSQCSIWSREVK